MEARVSGIEKKTEAIVFFGDHIGATISVARRE